MIDQQDDGNNDGSSVLETIISSTLTEPTLPTPISRNILKALNRLGSRLIDIPAAYLEGKVEEMRAETRARIALIETSANEIARQMKIDPEYARTAANKFGQRIIREQINLDTICEKAVEQLGSNDASEGESNSEKSIDDDWLNTFEEEARKKSTEDMQDYFGRLLAGEIKKPGSSSIRAIRILGTLDQETARLFRKFCSAAIIFPGEIDIRVCSLEGTAGENSLSKYGLSFSQLNILNEYDLIISDYNSWREYQLCIAGATLSPEGVPLTPLPFEHQGKLWVLVPTKKRNPLTGFRLHGVALTSSGRRLSRIVHKEPTEEYTRDLIAFFETQNLQMTEVKTPAVHQEAGEE